ncbi:MAG: tRNA (guanosine(37)-N1)-methyltransferase TrmD [Oscillospiraceae bacterium]|nr:tRNA (guanosine(37)-N1)-methyltransferase TrmD [Oscillospiraceae bacterium]MBQ9938215.1 tRNA (guanosine(37)-N1)-methyltransferase TrmD [Oscillospiraceae bacterium]
MRIDIATLFPEMCEAFLGESIVGRARKAGYLDIACHNIRDYANNKHNRIDDPPYGGGMGMLMRAEPVYLCWEDACKDRETKPRVIYMSPQGKTLTQSMALEYSKMDSLFIICGHYEGIDERVLEEIVDDEVSIGDYVLTGGELGAMVFVDCVARLCKGVLADDECFTEESHFSGLLEYPHYTRPAVWRGRETPEVLLSGHHLNIQKWRRMKSVERTALKRPDMLEGDKINILTEEEKRLVKQLWAEKAQKEAEN